MDKELNMLQAHDLRRQGLKIQEIADQLGKSERTIYYYLSQRPEPRKIPERSSKLDSYKDFIDTILENDPDYNRILLFERLQKQNYSGGITILREYAATVSNRIKKKIVIRFETEPGYQAQVDWMYLGKQQINGKTKKVYGFVMVMGYSRKPFVIFTTAMTQSVLMACHIAAFIYFGGVPKEILYDNMKTAFVYDTDEYRWKPNRALLNFANHYGFVPRRCRVRKPQTKGKVERLILYIRKNLVPKAMESGFDNLEELNSYTLQWLDYINNRILRDFKETRNDRFEREKVHLKELPMTHYDCRETIDVKVSPRSFITFKTNLYSVPPVYLGETLTLEVHPFDNTALLFHRGDKIREFELETAGSSAMIYLEQDKEAILELWKKQNKIFIDRDISGKKNQLMLIEPENRDLNTYDVLCGTREAV